MAKNISTGIDIGSSQLRVVQLRKTQHGVKIERYFIENYNLSPKDLESPDIKKSKILEILSKIFKEIKPLNVISTVAKGEDNVRTISMPLIPEKSLREALKWGGQPDYIPFDLKEMIWDINISQVFRRKEEIKTDGKEKMDVVLVISKKEVVNRYLDIVENLKFSVDILESNVLAGINFSCFNSVVPGEKIWTKIDFGAETTAINILEGNNLRLSLNVPWGVNDTIETVQSVLNKNWEESIEFIKGLDFSKDIGSQDESTRKVFQVLEPKIKDFLRQLSGAFGFYESKHPGKTVADVLLSGGGANLLGIDKYLMDKIGKQVYIEKINKNLISFEKKEEEKLNSLVCFLDVAIGAALRNLLPVKNNVNLLPVEIIIGRKLKSRRFSIMTVASILFLILLAGSVCKFNERGKVVKEIKILQSDFLAISAETNELYKMSQAIDSFKETEREYGYVKKNMIPWNSIIYELVSLVPDKTQLSHASWDMSGFKTNGKCPKKNDQVKQFIDNTEQSKYFKGLTAPATRPSGEDITFSTGKREDRRKNVGK
ncbi:MAG: pilus assembly protein PilM [Candidatus Firestonebacteria bacterium]